MRQRIHVNFIGQTVHPRVAVAAIEVLSASDFETEIPWPGVRASVRTFKMAGQSFHTHVLEVFNEEGEITYTSSVGMSSKEHPYDLKVEKPEVFVYIDKDTGEVAVSRGGRVPVSKQVVGKIEGALMHFFPSWEEADWAVGSNQYGSHGIWFAQDIIEWCEARAEAARAKINSKEQAG